MTPEENSIFLSFILRDDLTPENQEVFQLSITPANGSPAFGCFVTNGCYQQMEVVIIDDDGGLLYNRYLWPFYSQAYKLPCVSTCYLGLIRARVLCQQKGWDRGGWVAPGCFAHSSCKAWLYKGHGHWHLVDYNSCPGFVNRLRRCYAHPLGSSFLTGKASWGLSRCLPTKPECWLAPVSRSQTPARVWLRETS